MEEAYTVPIEGAYTVIIIREDLVYPWRKPTLCP